MEFLKSVLIRECITASISQQRIILLSFLLVLGLMAWWQSAGVSFDHSAQKFYPAPVVDVDFTKAESSWSGLRVDRQGNLVIDAVTESALLDAMSLARGDPNSPLLTRMALLLEKQFGSVASKQVMALLPVLKNYKAFEQRWWEENGGRNPPAYEELFQIQDEVLGESLASSMFSDQRRLARMMLASHEIQNDAKLTQAQREQALEVLRKNFQEAASDE
jgi:hypothetical protein